MKRANLIIATTLLAGLLAGVTGCESTDAVDRDPVDQDPHPGAGGHGGHGGAGGEAGAGGSGGEAGAGGSGGEAGAGGSGGEAGAGGSGGAGGAGGAPCVPQDDMNDCTEDLCDPSGAPVHQDVPAGAACNHGGGHVCDGQGACVGCLSDTDCAAPQYCDEPAQACVDPTCTDQQQNGDETGLDCGGPACMPCPDGQGCAVAQDCQSGVCADDGGGQLTCAAPTCGDGVVNGTDGCDDGNLIDGDGCDSNCVPTGCGNGVVSLGEGCDDGNTADGDGCDSNCTPTGCGNGIPTAGETCDDGNSADGDGCDGNCTPTGCGNGVPTAGEGCDDGNTADGDGCDGNCTPTGCGNGILTAGEACDDGNSVDDDACANDCTSTLPPYFPPCAPGQLTVVVQNDSPQGIPDANATGITRNVTVSAGGTVARASVLYTITHTYTGDLDLSLIPPGGAPIDICSDNGGLGDNFTNTLLDPTCSAGVTTGSAPFTGCYAPENVAQVTALSGIPANGVWGLRVVDDAGADLGTLQTWKLILCTTP